MGVSEELLTKFEHAQGVSYIRFANEIAMVADMQKHIADMSDEWETTYDKLFNKNQEINATVRERENLERRYDNMLNNHTASAQEYAEVQMQ